MTDVLPASPDVETVRAFPNTCLHRGRTLRRCGGNIGRIRCPYHGFTWEIDGTLKAVPTEWDFRGQIDRERWRLPEASVAVWGGFVFVNPNPNAAPFERYLGDLARHFERTPLDAWTVGAHAAQIAPAQSVLEVPAGMHAWDMFSDIQRARMQRAGIQTEYSDAEMVDLQTYYLFPNLIILGGPRGTILRFRPAGRPDRSIVEIIGLAPPRPGKEPLAAPEVTWIESGRDFSSDKRFADYELVDQDMTNVIASQRAMARLRDRPLTSRYQEASVAYFHQLLYEDWLG